MLTLKELGQRYAAFGQALQSRDTTIRDLVALAEECGLAVQIRVLRPEPEQAPDNPPEKPPMDYPGYAEG